MKFRTFYNLLLGALLSGCTVTNSLHNTITLAQDEAGRLVTLENKDTFEREEEPVLYSPVPPDEPREAKQTKQPPATKLKPEKKISRYCEVYDPLAPPEPVRYDAKAYAAAIEAEDYAETSQVLKRNIIAINKQMHEYKINLKRHQDAWKRACGK